MTSNRRQFSKVMLGTIASLAIPNRFALGFQSKTSISKSPYPPVSIQYVPGRFQSRYADLGGVLDTTTGLIWGYEPTDFENTSSTFTSALNVDRWMKEVLQKIASSAPDPVNRSYYADAFQVVSSRTWRLPTVFEARDAVAKGLFTLGDTGCNLYFSRPDAVAPGLAYGGGIRWSSSQIPKGLVHAWDGNDGGTLLVGTGSAIRLLAVSQL